MIQTEITIDVLGEADTERLGRALAESIGDAVVALDGPLGAGKTRLVQAMAAFCGVDRADVVSPTFVLIHEYRGSRPIYHIDAYRLRDDDEFLQLGVDEYFLPPNLVLIEWATRVARCLPDERVEVAIDVLSDEGRRFRIIGHGARLAQAIEQVGKTFAAK